MCFGIIEVVTKKAPTEKVYEYPANERDFIERINSLQADEENILSATVFKREYKLTRKIAWEKTP